MINAQQLDKLKIRLKDALKKSENLPPYPAQTMQVDIRLLSDILTEIEKLKEAIQRSGT